MAAKLRMLAVLGLASLAIVAADHVVQWEVGKVGCDKILDQYGSLTFEFDGNHTLSFLPSREQFLSCNFSGAIEVATAGPTTVAFRETGTYFLASETGDDCDDNLKLTVIVPCNDPTTSTTVVPSTTSGATTVTTRTTDRGGDGEGNGNGGDGEGGGDGGDGEGGGNGGGGVSAPTPSPGDDEQNSDGSGDNGAAGTNAISVTLAVFATILAFIHYC